jgi:hypothetical protein
MGDGMNVRRLKGAIALPMGDYTLVVKPDRPKLPLMFPKRDAAKFQVISLKIANLLQTSLLTVEFLPKVRRKLAFIKGGVGVHKFE